MWDLREGRGRSSQSAIEALNTTYGGNANKANYPLTIAEITETIAPVKHIKDVSKFRGDVWLGGSNLNVNFQRPPTFPNGY